MSRAPSFSPAFPPTYPSLCAFSYHGWLVVLVLMVVVLVLVVLGVVVVVVVVVVVGFVGFACLPSGSFGLRLVCVGSLVFVRVGRGLGCS